MIGQQLSRLPDYRLFVSDDVEETRSRISTVMQPHDLRPLGKNGLCRAQMSFLRLPNIGIGTISFGRMAVHLDRIEDYHLMILCSRGQADVRIGNRTVSIHGSQGMCIAPGEAFRAEFSDDCEQLVFRIDDRALRRNSGRPEARLRNLFDLRAAPLHPWVSCAKLLLDDPAMMAVIHGDPLVGAGYEQMFLGTVIGALGMGDTPDRRSVAPAAVKRAEDYIDENIGNSIALGDIATAAGVPVRTLLDSFQRFRQASPMRYLRDRRLDAAHYRLSHDPEATVTSAALDAGFTHLGRFSQAYRTRFGEAPSQRHRRGR